MRVTGDRDILSLASMFNGDFDVVGKYRLAEIVSISRTEATLSVFFHSTGGHGDSSSGHYSRPSLSGEAHQERFSVGGPTTGVFPTNSDSKSSRFSVPFLKAGAPIGKTSVSTVFSFATRLLHSLDPFAFPCM
jgi:hypothetical protein